MAELVTSVSFPYFQKYGKRMVSTFLELVDKSITLKIYHEASVEGKQVKDYGIPDSSRVVPVDLYKRTKALEFVQKAQEIIKNKVGRTSSDPDERLSYIARNEHDYRWDAVTFGKKGLSFVHAARTRWENRLFWADADIVFRKKMPASVFESLFSEGSDVVHFGREYPHTETGFFGIDLSSFRSNKFIEEYAAFWEKGEVFQLEAGWTDSHVFDAALARCKKSVGLKARNLSTIPRGHVIAASPLGDYMDHQKGPRKQAGFSYEAK